MSQSSIDQSYFEMQKKIAIASGHPLLHIKQLIPLLECRNELALKYVNGVFNEREKEICIQHLDSINEKIKLILGI